MVQIMKAIQGRQQFILSACIHVKIISLVNFILFVILKRQSYQDLVLLKNPVKVLVLIGNPLIVARPC